MERTFEVMTPQAEEIEMLYSHKGMTTYSLYNKSLFMEMVSSTARFETEPTSVITSLEFCCSHSDEWTCYVDISRQGDFGHLDKEDIEEYIFSFDSHEGMTGLRDHIVELHDKKVKSYHE